MDEQQKQDIQALIRMEQFDLARSKLQPLAMDDDEALEMLERLNKIAPPKPATTYRGTNAPARGDKDKTTAGILALFVGGLGVHKFYLGDTTMGIIYLLFCWTFVPAIVAFVEGILYLTMSDDEFYAKHVVQSTTEASSSYNAPSVKKKT